MSVKNIYNSFNFTSSYKKKLINFLRENTTIESGGYKIFNGLYDHLLQIPEEFANLIIELKKNDKKYKIKNFLEIGFSHGFSNTVLHKFFNFDKNDVIDKFGPHINGYSLFANLRFKNLILFCGDTKDPKINQNLKKLKNFDLILIDADHNYQSVKNDFKLALSVSTKKTIFVFHDIAHENSCSKKFWSEIKRDKKYLFKEFISGDHKFKYGTGILKIKKH